MDRHRGQVHRALRADRRRHAFAGAVGRGGRLLLRRLPRQRRHAAVPIKVRSHRRGAAPAGDGRPRTRAAGDAGDAPEALRGFPRAGRARRPGGRVTAESSRCPTWTPSRSVSSRRGEVRRVLARVFDESEFLSPHGLRALSKYHDDHPVWVDLAGMHVSVDYEPAESRTGMFGGNSNWRGPVWMPVNYLVLRNLQRIRPIARGDGGDRVPDGKRPDAVAGRSAPTTFGERLISLFLGEPTAADRATAGSPSCRTTRAGATTSRSTSTSTATTARGSVPPTRRAGPGLVADLICRPDPFAGRPWEL